MLESVNDCSEEQLHSGRDKMTALPEIEIVADSELLTRVPNGSATCKNGDGGGVLGDGMLKY